jgi:hypothetical protein
MEKERKQNYRIICIKSPKWLVPFFRAIASKQDKKGE